MIRKAQLAFILMFACLLLAGLVMDRAGAANGDGLTRYVTEDRNRAFTQPRHDLALAFTVPGMVTSAAVKPGDRVTKDQLLIELEDKEGQAQIDILELQNASNVAVDSAQAQLDMAEWEVTRLEGLARGDAGSKLELKRAMIQQRIAKLQLDQANLEKAQLVHQLDRAKATHARYKLVAPIDGIVERVAVAQGETVEQLKPIVMLVVTDPLWIDAWLPVGQTLQLKTGDRAWVRTKLPGHYDKPTQGRIIHLGQVADAASDRRLVRVEMANSQQLPAGIEVTVAFDQPPASAKADSQQK